MYKLFKAELSKYIQEIKCYYPDQIVSIVVTVLTSICFLVINNRNSAEVYIGFVYWYLLNSVISEASVSISSEKQMGILDQLILKPFPFEQLIIVRTIVWLLINLVKVIIVFSILFTLLQIHIEFNIQYLFIFLISACGMFGFTLLLVGLTLKYTKTASFESIISYSLLLLTGAVLPTDLMPSWLIDMGSFLPISKGIFLSRQLSIGFSVSITDYTILILQSFIFICIGYGVFLLIYKSSKKSGIDRRY
ncbi:ABC transporter permease [Streptococcus sp. DD13]|uniref:ABC transporter permease n=1 Tax=Streptococcus sp. DD13 TaxID=1777881 RepID=UPI000798431D|nr:ABC transporter permease [Streptococcus sp. DD13]KXT77880.1 hypothetical protein STRDD13_01220 [Streptococcus sp. DD13]